MKNLLVIMHTMFRSYYAYYVQEHGFPEGCAPKASSSEPEYINCVDDMHDISGESWKETKQYSREPEYINTVGQLHSFTIETLTSGMDDNFETSIKNPILDVSCDEIPPCTPPDDKYLESWIPCDIETQLFEEDGFEKNEKYRHGLDTSDEASLISDIDGDDDYWNFIENPTYDTFENIFENPIHDMISKNCSSETYESYKEEQSEFLYDQ